MIESTPTQTGGQALVSTLVALGARRGFGVPGESYLAVLDALYDVKARMPFVTCRHEAGAANMAEAWGKLTGTPGICFVTRGPGATHASAGIHTARQDSTPMILFVGQVPTAHRGREAFQELNYQAAFGSVAKWVCEVQHPKEVVETVVRAWEIALSGRPGPVVIALPEDVLSADAGVVDVRSPEIVQPSPAPEGISITFDLLASAKRPLVLVGGSTWKKESAIAFCEFAEQNNLPVAASFRRQHLFNNASRAYVGDSGLGINPLLERHIIEADVILALGTRLGEIVTGGYTRLAVPHPEQKLIHVLPDEDELNSVYEADVAITATSNNFVNAIVGKDIPNSDERRERLFSMRADYEAWVRPCECPGRLQVARVIESLSQMLGDEDVVCNGAGNYAAWLHRFYSHRSYGSQLGPTSGAMGYGLPASVAAKLAHPDRTVVACAGDGCFQMISQELATAVQFEANIIVLVFNNGMLGTIRMHQERQYPARVSATDLSNPDFTALAEAYGVAGFRVSTTEEFVPAFKAACEAGRPALIELMVDPRAISPGSTLSDLGKSGTE